jgi:hypothetical protein
MPPVSSQGSRTAAVTWAVVFAILFVTSTIFAIYFYANSSKVDDLFTGYKKTVADVVTEPDMQGDVVTRLRQVRGEEGSGFTATTPLIQVAAQQREAMARMIAGSGNEANAQREATAALAAAASAAKAAGLVVPTQENLAGALRSVAQGLTAQLKLNQDLQTQLATAQKQNAAQSAQFDQQRGEMNKNLEQIRAEQQAAVASVANYQGTKDASVAEIEKARETERKAAADAQTAAQTQVAELNRQLTSANTKIETLNNKFSDKRVNTKDPVVRHADGKIIRIPGKDVVYINLGSAESITPGLTFEVYDKVDGIPPAGDPTNDDNLPKGKASIEVVRVGAGSSEARVVRQTPGTQVTEGDLIANLVYDPNVKYNFVVYGDFDMDRNGVATPQDADVVRRLITQWGGKLMDQVNVDTDFVVLGKEPVLPVFTKEELQDPFNAKKLSDAQAALDAYVQVRRTASDLHIPIVNQNRFLYLIGYYDQSRR